MKNYPLSKSQNFIGAARYLGMAKLKLKIEGMACEKCVAKVEEALKNKGVSDLHVKIGSASCTYDESSVSEEQLVEAVVDAGFPAKVKKGLF